MVGRVAELTELRSATAALMTGRGGVVLVQGEPGVGKTALVREAAARAEEHGHLVLWGSGDELTSSMLFSPFLEALTITPFSADDRRQSIARMLGGTMPAGSSDELTTAIGEQITALVAEIADGAPTVLVVEDLHWCDPASLAVWTRLARLAVHLPLLLVGTLRRPPHDRRTLALQRSATRCIDLEPLDGGAVTELVGRLTGGTPTRRLLGLAGDAGGNPLYVTELVAALQRSGGLRVRDGDVELVDPTVPSSLAAAIAAHVDVLSPDVRAVLRAAALLGVEFAADDLTVVTGRPPAEVAAALEDGRDAGMLGDDEPAFRHPLLRSALFHDEVPAAASGPRAPGRGSARARSG